VLQADGGTRTAAITGSFVALVEALRRLRRLGQVGELPLRDFVAATSVGRVGGKVLLDLAYDEDSTAEVDMNVVGAEDGTLIEVQGTAEKGTFDRKQLDAMIDLATIGIKELAAAQRKVVG